MSFVAQGQNFTPSVTNFTGNVIDFVNALPAQTGTATNSATTTNAIMPYATVTSINGQVDWATVLSSNRNLVAFNHYYTGDLSGGRAGPTCWSRHRRSYPATWQWTRF